MKCLVFHSSKFIVLQFLKPLDTLLKSLDIEYTTFLTHPPEKITSDVITGIGNEMRKGIDFILCLGGDGTVLVNAKLAYYGRTTPVLAVNFGQLGFLAETTVDELEKTLIEFKNGEYLTEKRIVLSIEYKNTAGELTSITALNEVFIGGNPLHELSEFKASVDGLEIGRFKSDGIILATPTGSTAYSLSAGGPILLPALENFILVAVAPHRLTNRPIVLPANIEIELETLKGISQSLIIDGNYVQSLDVGSVVKISKHPLPLTLIYPKNRNYFNTLRKKLSWSL